MRPQDVPNIRELKEMDSPVIIDPTTVGCGFLLFPKEMSKTLNNVNIHEALQTNQSDFWAAVRRYNPSIPAYPLMSYHDVDPADAIGALNQMEKYPGYSIAISPMGVSPDGGKTFTRIFVGFNWKTMKQEIIVTIDQKILPGKPMKETSKPKMKNPEKKMWWQFWK
jgi:hypothetical protein